MTGSDHGVVSSSYILSLFGPRGGRGRAVCTGEGGGGVNIVSRDDKRYDRVISFIQDNLHNFGRNPDKEVGAHIGKRSTTEPTLPARSSVQDVYGSGVQHIIADNGYGGEEPPRLLRRQASNSSLDNVALRQIIHSSAENDGGSGGGGGADVGESVAKLASFANLGKQNSEKGINFTYMEQERQDHHDHVAVKPGKKHGHSNGNGSAEKKITTFATLPNTTTWQQQSSQQSQQMEQHSVGEPSSPQEKCHLIIMLLSLSSSFQRSSIPLYEFKYLFSSSLSPSGQAGNFARNCASLKFINRHND